MRGCAPRADAWLVAVCEAEAAEEEEVDRRREEHRRHDDEEVLDHEEGHPGPTAAGACELLPGAGTRSTAAQGSMRTGCCHSGDASSWGEYLFGDI